MEFKPYRFEFKYYVSNLVANDIAARVKKYLNQDKNATFPDGSYTVTSLYYDSYRYTDYWEKTGGNIRRKKIRLRIYEPYLKDSKYVFFEIKHKDDMMNRKTKIRLTRGEAEELLKQGKSFFYSYDWKKNKKEKQRVLYYLTKEPVKPRVLITYRRKAFMSPEKNLRITFDSQIEASRQINLNKSEFLHPVHKHATIIEIKFQYALQYWLKDIIREYNLERDTFSKYERSLEVLNNYNPLLR